MNRMNATLQDQVAWITGAASGMGAATARLFAERGAKVALIDVQTELGEQLAAELSHKGHVAKFFRCDVGCENDVRESLKETSSAFGPVRSIVNCAGIVDVRLMHESTEQQWDRLMAINVKSIFFSLKHGLPYLSEHPRSYMVNVGSIGSFFGQGMTPAYSVSKAAVLQITRSIALDYAAYGLRCNCVCPGITDTPMLRYHLNTTGDAEGTLKQRLRRVPMGVAIQPPEIAKAIAYFCCEESSGISGTSLVVDGGLLAASEWDTTETRFQKDSP
jgi:NAD(P)-dependent dehydrogenase (short-subunit alcohol dehydrogenase family)